MIARQETYVDRTALWARLAAPLPGGVISWRQDGAVIARDGRFYARFVAGVDANTVRERLDGVVPGEWDLTLELLPPLSSRTDEGDHCAFKARLQVIGVIREDVGTGCDYKSAATDAFRRVAVRFGIARELHALEQNWVQMDGDGRGARPLERPGAAYQRRFGATAPVRTGDAVGPVDEADESPRQARSTHPARGGTIRQNAGARATEALEQADAAVPDCPQCGGRMWDNRRSKRKPNAPDFKCRDRSCDGVVWPVRTERSTSSPSPAAPETPAPRSADGPRPQMDDADAAMADASGDDLPF